MPHLQKEQKCQPLWKTWDDKANKKGIHHTVYLVNGDEYTGDWLKNKKHGKGTYIWKKTGAIYDGDWQNDQRSGYGTLSVPVDAGFKKLYSGGWKADKKHGYGTYYYTDNEHYEGEWFCDLRSGWGRMYYEDGSIYEGEWQNDQRSGEGMIRLANLNRYEGAWKNDKKNGPGRFFYLDTGQLFEGAWLDDIPKCGAMIDYGRENVPNPTPYPMPPIEVSSPDGVIQEAIDNLAKSQD